MKKLLLIGSAVLITMSANSQTAKLVQPSGTFDLAEKIRKERAIKIEADASAGRSAHGPLISNDPQNSSSNSSSSPIISATFNKFTGSMNVFGMLVSSQKALQYNRFLQAYSFIQRKHPFYITNPALPANAQSGAIVAFIGKNEGTLWDSTLLYSDASRWSRYPQGGIYNPSNSSNLAAAYVVGSGPCTGSSDNWVGSWYASKLIGAAGTNSAGADQQFFSNTPPFGTTTSPTMTKHDFPRSGFAATDDGIVRSLGEISRDVNDVSSNANYGFRGALVSKGSFNSGAFVWTPDSMIPPAALSSDGLVLSSQPYMAWNDAGTVGYVMLIGSRQGSTLSNKGYQPMIYKTTNSGNSWILLNGIDFNTGNWTFLKNSMQSVSANPTLEIPFFKYDEGIDMVVDNNNKLHIASMVVGTAKEHVDSLGYTFQYSISGDTYAWPHINTARPYIFDFCGDGLGAWTHTLIDSLGTEGPSSVSGQGGFIYNPWADAGDPSASVDSDSRLQLSRTYDGQFIVYSWGESDTTINTAANKFHEFPNIHQKALRLCDGKVSTDEFLVSSPSTGFNPAVRDHAFFHFMSSTCKAGASNATQATFTVAYTVSNNAATDGVSPVTNYFANVVAIHTFPTASCGNTLTTGVASAKTEASQSLIYPNPTDSKFSVRLSLSAAKEISVDVYNAIGEKVAGTRANGQIGENTVPVNMNQAAAGVYFVKIKAGSSESTKKLVVE
jgi:hypothetical protein